MVQFVLSAVGVPMVLALCWFFFVSSWYWWWGLLSLLLVIGGEIGVGGPFLHVTLGCGYSPCFTFNVKSVSYRGNIS